jgi:hypothetical protein
VDRHQLKRRGLEWLDVTRDDFPLPRFAFALAGIAQELETGRGMILLRGLPLHYSSDELALNMAFEPGDIQLLNNHLIYHARTRYDDYEEPERKRLLLRLWLAVPGSRPLPAGYELVFGNIEAGDDTLHAPLGTPRLGASAAARGGQQAMLEAGVEFAG